MILEALPLDKQHMVYYNKKTDEGKCIGYLRGDFGRSGSEFWTSWFDVRTELKNAKFREDLQKTVNELREAGNILHDYSTMIKNLHFGTELGFGSYGFCFNTDYHYCLRCIHRIGDYNFYLYCYEGEEE